jgi:hypothetical protein
VPQSWSNGRRWSLIASAWSSSDETSLRFILVLPKHHGLPRGTHSP